MCEQVGILNDAYFNSLVEYYVSFYRNYFNEFLLEQELIANVISSPYYNKLFLENDIENQTEQNLYFEAFAPCPIEVEEYDVDYNDYDDYDDYFEREQSDILDEIMSEEAYAYYYDDDECVNDSDLYLDFSHTGDDFDFEPYEDSSYNDDYYDEDCA